MQVTCPACKKTLQSKADLSGKTVKCGCGHSFAVAKAPAASQVAASSNAVPANPSASGSGSAAVSGKIAVKCSCGKTLQAPAAAAGKAVKCPCGQVVKVPAPAAATTAAAAPAKRQAAAVPVAAMSSSAAPARRPASQPAPRPAAQPAAQSAFVSTAPNPFADISDAEWQSMVQSNAPKVVDQSKPKEKSAAAKMLEEARKETGKGNVLAMDSAKGFLNKTRGILVGIGLLILVRVAIDYWLSMGELEQLAATEDAEVVAVVKTVVMVFLGIGAGIATLFIVLGFMVSIIPMTSTIVALVMYSLIELLGLLLNPFSLISIRGWIFRITIFGALIQGINNAAYFKHLKAEEKEAKRARGG